MKDDVDRAMQRTRRYWYEDGLVEIAAGCIFVLIGLMFLVEAVSPPGALPPNFSSIGLIVIVFGGMWAARRLVAAAKERITYPRTGYVQFGQPPAPLRGATAAVAIVMGALVAMLLALAPASLVVLPALQGIAVGVFILVAGHRVALPRFYVLAVVSTLIGVILSLAGTSESLGAAIYYGLMGIALIISGVLTLVSYLRANQGRAEE